MMSDHTTSPADGEPEVDDDAVHGARVLEFTRVEHHTQSLAHNATVLGNLATETDLPKTNHDMLEIAARLSEVAVNEWLIGGEYLTRSEYEQMRSEMIGRARHIAIRAASVINDAERIAEALEGLPPLDDPDSLEDEIDTIGQDMNAGTDGDRGTLTAVLALWERTTPAGLINRAASDRLRRTFDAQLGRLTHPGEASPVDQWRNEYLYGNTATGAPARADWTDPEVWIYLADTARSGAELWAAWQRIDTAPLDTGDAFMIRDRFIANYLATDRTIDGFEDALTAYHAKPSLHARARGATHAATLEALIRYLSGGKPTVDVTADGETLALMRRITRRWATIQEHAAGGDPFPPLAAAAHAVAKAIQSWRADLYEVSINAVQFAGSDDDSLTPKDRYTLLYYAIWDALSAGDDVHRERLTAAVEIADANGYITSDHTQRLQTHLAHGYPAETLDDTGIGITVAEAAAKLTPADIDAAQRAAGAALRHRN